MYDQGSRVGPQEASEEGAEPMRDLTGRVLTPKKPLVDSSGAADIFPYYAGFSFDWARHLLDEQAFGENSVVLDPWNGSGTTTVAAQSLGYLSIGVDLNPVAEVVANVRSRRPSKDIEQRFPGRPISVKVTSADPLTAWFRLSTVRRIRGWLAAFDEADVELREIGIVSAFLAVQRLTYSFQGSNPTWVKVARMPEEQLSVPAAKVDESIVQSFISIAERSKEIPPAVKAALHIRGSSKELPIRDRTVSTILTSPPYLTRIDYAVAYRRELAVLGIDTRNKSSLRSRLMGTTAIRSAKPAGFQVHTKASQLLKSIAEHPSYASATYYSKQAVQYFGDLAASLSELSRVSRQGASMTLVVQDSFYKDILLPLAEICVEESEAQGWKLQKHRRIEVKRSMGTLNLAAKNYKKSAVTESIMTFKRVNNA